MAKSESFNSCSLEHMRACNPNQYGIGLSDPPYGIGESGKASKDRGKLFNKSGTRMRRKASNNYSKKNWDDEIPADEFFIELFRTTVNQIIFGANYFPFVCGTAFKTPRRNEYDQFIKDHPTGWIIWDKVNSTNDFNDCELIWTSFNEPTHIFYFMWSGMMQGKSASEGWIMQGDKKLNEVRIHPTQKPVPVYAYLIMRYRKHFTSVIDTHGGSGSSRLACDSAGIAFTMFETDKEYFDLSEQRYHNKKQILTLF